MDFHPLADENLEEAIGFLRGANPFSQRTWGWDTGRFIDFRWGNNVLRDRAGPGFFARHGTVVRTDGDVVALVLSEDGREDHCILTASEDSSVMSSALTWLIQRREGERLVLYPSDEATWIHDVLTEHGFERGEVAGLDWEYDITTVDPPLPPEGFVVGSIVGEDDYPGIDKCLEAAFGFKRDRIAVLESLATNPMFRPDLSIVARSPEGSIAAYCRGTVDPDNGVGSIDPVATHPDYQGRGLGKAIVRACFATQSELGGRESYIGSGPEGSAGSYLYRSLGPVSTTSHSEWTQPPQ
jgi:ribosomal protein S18 acetylase RimI-like enzyme